MMERESINGEVHDLIGNPVEIGSGHAAVRQSKPA